MHTSSWFLAIAVLTACKHTDGACDAETVSWTDRDGDGFGDPATATAACTVPAGSVENGADCDDAAGDVHPGALEVCDGVDDDCDATVDPDPTTWFVDADGDGYGTSVATVSACARPDGYAASDDDCDDADATVHPSASEVCNGVDDDCQNGIDDAFDADGDGYFALGCGDDCDDENTDVHPGASDYCADGVDGNCVDGEADCVFGGEISLEHADSKTYAAGAMEAFGRVLDVGDVNGDGEVDVLGGAPYMNDYLGGGYVAYGPFDGVHVATDVGFRLENTAAHPLRCGSSVSVGDVDGDGYDDVALGGEDGLYVEFGPIDADLDLAEADFSAVGPENSMFGIALDLADVNADGQADLVVGAPTDPSGDTAGGALYVAFGPLTAGERNLGTDHDAALVDGSEGEELGLLVKVGGDFNGDGVVDTMVQTGGYAPTGVTIYNAAFVLFGPLDEDRPLDEPDAILVGPKPTTGAGQALAQGDADGDGISDAAVGAPMTAVDGAAYAGAAYVVAGPLSGVVELDESAALTVLGTVAESRAGTSLAFGNVTGDDTADLVVSAPTLGKGGFVDGSVYYFEAPLSGTVAVDDAVAVFVGEEAGDGAGTDVQLTDLDHDGLMEFVIASPYEETSGRWAGAVYTFGAE